MIHFLLGFSFLAGAMYVYMYVSFFGSVLGMKKQSSYMGVSENRGSPKWMVYNGKPYKNG